MSSTVEILKTAIYKDMESAVKRAIDKGNLPDERVENFIIEIPADRKNGDLSANLALISSKVFRLPPRKIAEIILDEYEDSSKIIEKADVAGPGFINFYFGESFYNRVVRDVMEAGADYGRSDYGKGKKVLVEFVSANPTGPMHIGNARGGALGDCLASCLEAAGYNVYREFYVNDAGNQIEKFASSLEARYLQIFLGEDRVEFPEDGYYGDDIKEHAEAFAAEYKDGYLDCDSDMRKAELVKFALPKNIAKLKGDLEKYRIVYDSWFRESSLYQSGEIDETIEILKSRNLTYEKEGALWYKATEMGGEKDEVLIRANGNPTYFAADIAYHRNKFLNRGFDICINIWGADHHGHVARLKGAMDAIGIDKGRLDIVIMQLVRLMRGDELVRMSKRTGKTITLSDLLDEIPVDAARFFFNLREPNSHLDFDLELAAKQSSDNPVYYVQYAHARICSIIKNLKAEGIVLGDVTDEELSLMNSEQERDLIRHISYFPSEIVETAKEYNPARITRYSIELANKFHRFYNACRVKCDNKSLMQARLMLCHAVKQTLCNLLSLLKISAPEVM